MEFKIYKGLNGYLSIKEEWNDLLRRCNAVKYYQSPLWIQAYLEHLCIYPDNIYIFAIYKNKVLIALFILEQRKEKYHFVKIDTLAFISHNHASLSDFIIDRNEDAFKIFSFLYASLSKNKTIQWDLLAFNKVLDNTIAFKVLSHCNKYLLVSKIGTNCDAIKLDNLYEYIDSLSKNFIRNFRKAKNKLAKLDTVEYITCKTDHQLKYAFKAFLEIEASGWKGEEGSQSAIYLNNTLTSFYSDITEHFGSQGLIEINIMKIDTIEVAAQFCIVMDNVVYMLKIGYDEKYAKFQPGHLLLEHMLYDYNKRGDIKEVNLITDASWHRSWKPKIYFGFNYQLGRKSLKGVLFILLTRLRSLMKFTG